VVITTKNQYILRNSSRSSYLLLIQTAIFLVLSLSPLLAYSADVTLAWDANTEPELAGYRIYWGVSSREYSNSVDIGNTTQHTFTGLTKGTTYYAAVTAYDASNNESDYSEEVIHIPGSRNNPPNTPAIPGGPSNGYPQTSYKFITAASDPDYDDINYRYHWGDGQTTDWGSFSRSHSWSSSGTFCVKAQAKDEHGATSLWSGCRSIAIGTQTHTIIATGGVNGNIEPSGTLSITHGANQSFTITPVLGHHIADVIVDGTSVGAVDSFTFTNVIHDHTISVSFTSANKPPKAEAGLDQIVKPGKIVRLIGTNSSDPDDGIMKYSWKQVSGKRAMLLNARSSNALLISPQFKDYAETLTFELTVTDHGGLQNTDSCLVYVSDIVIVDTDHDGVPDSDDVFPFDPNEWEDTDDDGIGNNADTDDDNDGLSDTDEINLYTTDPSNPDSDGDGYTDGEEIRGGTDPLDPESIPLPQSLIFEVGRINVDHNWVYVNLKEIYSDPVVVASSISLNDNEPAVIRIRNVDNKGFEICIQEWEYLDGIHASETVGYLVMERGVYTLHDGTRVEADYFETNKVNNFETVSFVQTYQEIPIVITTVSTVNGSDAVSGRLSQSTPQNFQFCLQKQELNLETHHTETINYIAWEPSVGNINGLTFEANVTKRIVGHGFRTIRFNQILPSPPLFFGEIQTSYSMDTANVRWQAVNNLSMKVQIDEEQSKDSEISHTPEKVGYILFSYQ